MSYGVYTNYSVFTNENGDELSNFIVQNPQIFYEAADGCTPRILRVTIRHLCKRYQIDLDLKKPDLIKQIQREIPTCRVFGAAARSHIEAHILELQPEADDPSEDPPLFFGQHGFCRLPDSKWVFVSGDEVLGISEHQKRTIAPETARAHLTYSPEMSKMQAIKGLWKALSQNKEVLLPIYAFTLLSSMRSVLIDLNITTFPACSVTGRQGSGKTTTCQRFSLLYDDAWRPGRRWGEIDARSTRSATREIISRYRDQAVLLDDIAKSISPAQMRERRDLLADVLRFACNDTDWNRADPSGRIRERFCTAGLIYTGEFPIDNPSDINRTATVKIDKQMEGGSLRDRVFAATAFRYFMLWFLPRTDAAIAHLGQELDLISGDHQRLGKNRTMILWATQQFLCFAQECGIAERDADAMMKCAVRICDGIMREQIDQIAHLGAVDHLSSHILNGIQRGVIKRVSEKRLASEKPLPDYYYVHRKRDDTVYIRTEILYHYLTEKTPVHLVSLKAMNKLLIEEKVIRRRKEARATAVKINGGRYLDLRMADLVKAAAEEKH